MRRQNPETSSNILKLISEKPLGLTIEEVSRELRINRATASRHLAVLEAAGKILVRELGQSKLHYPKTRRIESCLL
jgi:DNA-binding IclR family transcriptional regulator